MPLSADAERSREELLASMQDPDFNRNLRNDIRFGVCLRLLVIDCEVATSDLAARTRGATVMKIRHATYGDQEAVDAFTFDERIALFAQAKLLILGHAPTIPEGNVEAIRRNRLLMRTDINAPDFPERIRDNGVFVEFLRRMIFDCSVPVHEIAGALGGRYDQRHIERWLTTGGSRMYNKPHRAKLFRTALIYLLDRD